MRELRKEAQRRLEKNRVLTRSNLFGISFPKAVAMIQGERRLVVDFSQNASHAGAEVGQTDMKDCFEIRKARPGESLLHPAGVPFSHFAEVANIVRCEKPDYFAQLKEEKSDAAIPISYRGKPTGLVLSRL